MIIIGRPGNSEDYVKVKMGRLNVRLQKAGFSPVYKYGDYFYYLATDKFKKYFRFKGILPLN